MLFWEAKLIHKLREKTMVPQLHYIGTEESNPQSIKHIMVMDILGKSLDDLFEACGRKFDVRTCLLIAV